MSSRSIRFLWVICLFLLFVLLSFAQTNSKTVRTAESKAASLRPDAPRTLHDLVRAQRAFRNLRPVRAAAQPAASAQAVQSYTIATEAGNGIDGYSGDGGLATSAAESFPVGAAYDSAGNLYVVEMGNNIVRKVTAAGIISTVAGNGAAGFSGDGGPATSAKLNYPAGVAVDTAGNLYIADGDNHRIRKVVNGTITTIAGNGIAGYTGNGGQAISAELDTPEHLRFDAQGNLLFADPAQNVIRKIAPSGIITTVAGTGDLGLIGDEGPATSAHLWNPNGVAVDAAGNIYIADTGNYAIRKVDIYGIIHNFAGDYFSSGFSGDNGPASNALLDNPFDVDVDAAGNVFIPDTYNQRVRVVTTDNIIHTIAGTGVDGYSGDGGAATSAHLSFPIGICPAASGSVHLADAGNNVMRLLSTQQLQPPSLIVTKTHVGNFVAGQAGATYTVVVSNASGSSPTSGTVTVTDAMPAGLTLVSIAGTGWTCATNTCTRDDALNGGASYPPLTVTVNVASNAPATVINQVIASGGGDGATGVSDPTNVVSAPGVALTGGTLPNGLAGASYAADLSSHVTGGTAPYTWAAISGALPGGVSLNAGTGLIAGIPTAAGGFTFNVRVTDSFGLTSTAAFQVTISAAPAGTPARIGTLAHIAAGAGWKTTITIVNTDTRAIKLRINIYGESGALLALPLTFPQAGGGNPVTASFVERNLPANGSLVIESESGSSTQVGWVDVLATGHAGGAAIFRLRVSGRPDQEGTAVLDDHSQATVALPFDNTNGYIGAVAICDMAAAGTTVTATVYDENGALIGQQVLSPIPGWGHTSFALTDHIALAAGRRGVITFQSGTGAAIGALGLRFTPTLSFTSVPVMYP